MAPHAPARQGSCDARAGSASRFGDVVLSAPHFEAVAAVGGLDVEDLTAGDSEHALHRCGHVFVHAVGELDNNDGPFARRPYESPRDRPRAFSELAQYDVHTCNLALTRRPSTARAGAALNTLAAAPGW